MLTIHGLTACMLTFGVASLPAMAAPPGLSAARDAGPAVEAEVVVAAALSMGSCRPDPGFEPAADVDGDGCVGGHDLVLAVLPPQAVTGGRGGVTPPPAQAWAFYNAGQLGGLPPVTVTRGYATLDAAGAPVGPDQPRWGPPRARAPLQPWTLARSTTSSISWVIAGEDADGDKMLAYFRQGPAKIEFWLDADLDDGPPAMVIDVTRGSVNDLLVGTPLERPNHAYDPRGGVALPGCFMFLCVRWHDVHEDPANPLWKQEAVSVVAFQRDASGDFAFQIVGDGPVFSNALALGLDRASPWAMNAYYPINQGEVPLLNAFIPVVDYINDTDIKKGGQVFLIKATRADPFTPWSFGEMFMIDEHVENDTHFHTAGWTPRGVVVAMGDGTPLNENFLYTCSDWDDYANPANWTQHTRVFGAGVHPDAPSGTVATQFASSVPGRDPDHLLVGGDVMGAAVYECSVPRNPADGLGFARRWGEFWADDTSAGHVSLWLHKPAPERLGRVVSRTRSHGGSTADQNRSARVLYAEDGQHFLTVACYPTTLDRAAFPALYGDDIILCNRQGSGSPQGIWSIPAPRASGPVRGLVIGPGGHNRQADGVSLPGAAAGAGNTMTLITDGIDPVTGGPLGAPGLGPVLRLESQGASNVCLSYDPTGGVPVGPGFVYLPLWIKVLGPEGIDLIATLSDDAGGSVDWKQNINARGQWVPHTVLLGAGALSAPYAPHVELRTGAGAGHWFDFLVQVEGYYVGDPPAYPTAAGTTSPGEQITQPLGALGGAWTVGAELHVPPSAEDWLGHPAASAAGGRLALATLHAGPGDHAEIWADLAADVVGVDVYRGGAVAGSAEVAGVQIQRDDRVWLAIAGDGAGTTLAAWSGGSRENGFTAATTSAAMAAAPAELRFGRDDFTQVPVLEVLLVGVDRGRALAGQALLDLLSVPSPPAAQAVMAPWWPNGGLFCPSGPAGVP